MQFINDTFKQNYSEIKRSASEGQKVSVLMNKSLSHSFNQFVQNG